MVYLPAMRKSQAVLLALGFFCGVSALWLGSVARGPDFDIELTRKVPSRLSVDYLDQAWNLIRQWPAWMYAGVSADQVTETGSPVPKSEQKLKIGAYIRLGEDTKRGLHSRYSITVQVTEYIPRKKLSMRVIADSKNRLTHLLDSLEWSIELEPNGTGSWIYGKALARTRTWRARLFGKLAPKILLNQVYYPNLFILAEINNPYVVAPEADEQHSGM